MQANTIVLDMEKSELDWRMEETGRKLQLDSTGTVYKTESDSHGVCRTRIVYFNVPSKPSLVIMEPGVIVPFDSSILCALCENFDASCGRDVAWSCKVKERATCRMNAKCSFSGEIKASRGKGLRKMVSKKTNCSAHVSTVALKNEELAELSICLRNEPFFRANEESKFCVIKTTMFFS